MFLGVKLIDILLTILHTIIISLILVFVVLAPLLNPEAFAPEVVIVGIVFPLVFVFSESAINRVIQNSLSTNQPIKACLEINFAVDLVVNAISSIVVSIFILHFQPNPNKAILQNNSPIILAIDLFLTITIIIILQECYKQETCFTRNALIWLSNFMGLFALFISLLAFGRAIL